MAVGLFARGDFQYGGAFSHNESMSATTLEKPSALLPERETSLFRVLVAVSFCHMLNDMVQSLLPSVYPILKGSFHLNFGQIGLIALVNQVTASLLQPFVGLYTDRKAAPYFLPAGMTVTLTGLLMLAFAPTFGWLLVGAALVGVGSAVFHPESSRVARMASGGQHGFAQSFFQVGGNSGSAIGPLVAAFIVLPRGQHGMAWFSIFALIGVVVLFRVSNWAKHRRRSHPSTTAAGPSPHANLSKRQIGVAMTVLMTLVFSKYFYLSSLVAYYTFYLISRFHVSVHSSQLHLFAFLAAAAAGTFFGGPIGDRFGRKYVIWGSILGVLPFTLALPYANLFWTGVLSVIIGFVIASAFSAILVYAQELVPGRVGMISGLFFGLAFGMGGIGAAVLGKLADSTSIVFVYHVCAYLPAIGLLTGLLPDIEPRRLRKEPAPV
jgi:FSR family fosmidomycin resistance protein-like MFS transporter